MSFCALNEVALKRAKAVDDYVRLMLQLEEHFGTARMAMAKARTVVGHSYASVTHVDDRDLKPVIGMSISDDAGLMNFSLTDLEGFSDGPEKENEEKKGGNELRQRKKKTDEDGNALENEKDNKQPKGEGLEREENEKEQEQHRAAKCREGEEASRVRSPFRPYGLLEPSRVRSPFRPYGLLEPVSARQARDEMYQVLQITADLASLQALIKQCEDDTRTLQRKLTEEELSTIYEYLNISV